MSVYVEAHEYLRRGYANGWQQENHKKYCDKPVADVKQINKFPLLFYLSFRSVQVQFPNFFFFTLAGNEYGLKVQ